MTDDRPRARSRKQLAAVLAQAHDEAWTTLGLIEAGSLTRITPLWVPRDRVFYVHGDLRPHIAALRSLGALTGLSLAHVNLGDEGALTVASLRDLTHLHLFDSNIGPRGATALASLPRIVDLDLLANPIGNAGAKAVSAMIRLRSLSLAHCQIDDEGAQSLIRLSALEQLYLSSNDIGDAGAIAVARLPNLRSLHLDQNVIGDDGAVAIAGIPQLQSLNLAYNAIGIRGTTAVLDALAESDHRWLYFRLDHNPVPEAPLLAELLASFDAGAIRAAYIRFREERRRATLRPLDEAKMIVVGNEAVGKTSLVRALVEGRSRDRDEKKTRGAAIHEKIDVAAWSPDHTPIRLHVWDFGGQEIMRGTHRFFLTARSLYLLVIEDRREDDQRSIDEWLTLIEQRGGDSPVVVVINKSDGPIHQRAIDEPALRREHPTIVAVVRTSCNSDERATASIVSLRALIVATLRDSPRLAHVRATIPASWSRVKDALSMTAREHSVLTMREIERLCETADMESERVTDVDEQRALLGLLHDLGIIVAHGLRGDAPAAWREVTILDPNWLTKGIYELINSQIVRDQHGELGFEQLSELLDPTRYPVQWHELLASMMQDPALGLCFALPGRSPPRYLFPEALPASEPDYGMWPQDALRFRLQYDLLPKELLPRFIVESHRHVSERPTRWRTGAVLRIEGCQVLVRGELAHNRVEILVAGKIGQRAALGVVRSEFDAVHGQYAKIGVKAKVPLPDKPEVDVGYDHLVKLEALNGLDHRFLPEDADRQYAVRELLEGVRHDRVRYRGDAVEQDDGAPAPRRVIEVPTPEVPHVILLVSANPSDASALALQDEERAIREELARSPARDRFVLHVRGAAQPNDLLQALRELRPTIVQFSGHGRAEGLSFKQPGGGTQPVKGAALARVFGAKDSPVRVVVMNACDSAALVDDVRRHVEYVVGVEGKIEDAPAVEFSRGFYGALGARRSIEAAFADGQSAAAFVDPAAADQLRGAAKEGVDATALIIASEIAGR